MLDHDRTNGNAARIDKGGDHDSVPAIDSADLGLIMSLLLFGLLLFNVIRF